MNNNNNNIIPEVFKAPLAFTALEIPYMIQQHIREKEQRETNIEMMKLEAQLREQINNNLWSW